MSLILRKGWGTHFRQDPGSTWIHIPIGQVGLNMLVKVVFVLYRTDNATVTGLHLHDGFKLLKSFDGLSRFGDRLLNNNLNTAHNAWAFEPLMVSHGLGVSLEVRFGGFDQPGEILISAAGAYLEAP